MENEKLLQKIEELQNRIVQLEKKETKKDGFWAGTFKGMHVFTGVLISALITSAVLYAADMIEFKDGTIISAVEVNSNFTDLNTRLAALENTFSGVTRTAEKVIQFSGVNVQIINGEGSTAGTINGLGNLIVGYNEEHPDSSDKTGSHNIIVGSNHNYSSYGGLVAGFQNTIEGRYSFVSGFANNASGAGSSVSGGLLNTASGYYSSVSGGYKNEASGSNSSVTGGRNNNASAIYSSVNGGGNNAASGSCSSVSAGHNNEASVQFSSVIGGQNNTASADYSIAPKIN